MAYADYYLCDNCGAKAFYDADIDEDRFARIDIAALCEKCSKTHHCVVQVIPQPATTEPARLGRAGRGRNKV